MKTQFLKNSLHDNIQNKNSLKQIYQKNMMRRVSPKEGRGGSLVIENSCWEEATQEPGKWA